MPPAQCPECGRFLAKAFVQGLATEPAGCPKCGTQLSAEHFADDADPVSVRPPDLDPGRVRDAGEGPLADWDLDDDGRVLDLDRYRQTREPPPDAAILAGAGLIGALVGMLVARRRLLGALLGLLIGSGAAAAARQVWRLPD